MDSLPTPLAPLAGYPQFIVWRSVPDPSANKPRKVPYDPSTLRACDPHDPRNWMPADSAISFASMLGDEYGVGFVFTAADPFWFLDIDHCLVDGQWSATATGLVMQFAGAAVEVSYSGDGLHIFGSGVVPDHSSRNAAAHIEFYDKERFVALTGTSAYGDASTQHDAAINQLVATYFPPHGRDTGAGADRWSHDPTPEWNGPTDDETLIAKALGSGSIRQAFTGGVTFADLWRGNSDALGAKWPGEGRPFDASHADASLAQHLAFWTGKNCERIERLMRRSALLRDKWDRRERPPGYLRTTILRAVGNCKDVYASRQAAVPPPPASDSGRRRLRVTSAADVVPEIIEWVWPGILPKGKIVTLAGDPGIGKGVLTAFIAAHISTGNEWTSEAPCSLGTVAFLAQEDGKADTLVPRLISAGADLSRVRFIEGVINPGTDSDVPFDLGSSSAALDEWLTSNSDVNLLIIDPVNDFLGSNTDSYKDAEVRHTLNPLKIMAEKHGVTVLLVSHMNKGNAKADYRVMGAMAFTGIARMTFLITKSKDDPRLRLMLPVKANIAKDTTGYGYRIQENIVVLKSSNGPVMTPQPLVVLDPTPVLRTAQDELDTDSANSLNEEIRAFLEAELSDGPVPANVMKKRCEAAGQSYATVNKRKKQFGVVSTKGNSRESEWLWQFQMDDGPTTASVCPPDPSGDQLHVDRSSDGPGGHSSPVGPGLST